MNAPDPNLEAARAMLDQGPQLRLAPDPITAGKALDWLALRLHGDQGTVYATEDMVEVLQDLTGTISAEPEVTQSTNSRFSTSK